jgi:penicillin-binding protein 2
LLKSVRDDLKGEEVYKTEPEALDSINIGQKNLEAVMEGMLGVTENGTAASVFRNYPIKVGGKTGSAQTKEGSSAHGVFTAFAPYDNPEIAVCVIGEYAGSGSSVAPLRLISLIIISERIRISRTLSPENMLLR